MFYGLASLSSICYCDVVMRRHRYAAHIRSRFIMLSFPSRVFLFVHLDGQHGRVHQVQSGHGSELHVFRSGAASPDSPHGLPVVHFLHVRLLSQKYLFKGRRQKKMKKKVEEKSGFAFKGVVEVERRAESNQEGFVGGVYRSRATGNEEKQK